MRPAQSGGRRPLCRPAPWPEPSSAPERRRWTGTALGTTTPAKAQPRLLSAPSTTALGLKGVLSLTSWTGAAGARPPARLRGRRRRLAPREAAPLRAAPRARQAPLAARPPPQRMRGGSPAGGPGAGAARALPAGGGRGQGWGVSSCPPAAAVATAAAAAAWQAAAAAARWALRRRMGGRRPRSGFSSRPPSACPRSRTSSGGTSCSFAGSSSRGRWGEGPARRPLPAGGGGPGRAAGLANGSLSLSR